MIDPGKTPPAYPGPERRSGAERRKEEHERREEIRYEPAKAPRRSGHDRRNKHTGWDGGSTI